MSESLSVKDDKKGHQDKTKTDDSNSHQLNLYYEYH